MKKLTSDEIRQKWFDFFKNKGHMVVESAPLVPIGDDSLLFVNAGITPLKKYFDGREVPENKRIVSIQKCIRTNDIENVGITKSHLSFFEMMGNFSIGDYFKEEALEFALELLTKEFEIPQDKLYMTVYTSDDDAYNRWLELGIAEDHLIRLDGNYWEIGEGPCGPDSEIFYDRGEAYDPLGDALEKFKKDEDQERYIEIWNNVFSQYNSVAGLKREEYQELPSKNIDTGAGLERWATIFQEVDSVFDTDLFKPIIDEIAKLANKAYDASAPYKIIADHTRTVVMALADGAIFENHGRGYVLRRLLRRSVRMGKKLGLNEEFIYQLVVPIVNIMKETYPDLLERQGIIKTMIYDEEELFHKTLSAGEKRLEQLIAEAKLADNTISGYDAFKLYDTYGFPFELTKEYLEEANITTSEAEYIKYMNLQKELARKNQKSSASMTEQNEDLLNFKEESVFDYDEEEMTSKVIAIFKDGHLVDETDSDAYLIFDKTVFYAESGGQVADRGAIKNDKFKAKVVDVQKAPNNQHLHQIEVLEGSIKVGDELLIKIMGDERAKIRRNHSAVHLLQKALQETIDMGIKQAGSYVDNERLRFDFNCTAKISDDTILKVEERVNELIKENTPVEILNMTLEEAKELKAIALFEDKYSEMVRVIKMGEVIELCGGTHVNNTSEIRSLAILNFESKGSNVYRVEALTAGNIKYFLAEAITPYVEEISKLLNKAKNILKQAKEEEINLKFDLEIETTELDSYRAIIFNRNQLEYVQSEVKKLEREFNNKIIEKKASDVSMYLNTMEKINGFELVIIKTEMDLKILKSVVDNIINQLKNGFVFVANKAETGVNFIASSNSIIHAGLMMKKAVEMVDGNGGGKETFATGGTKKTEGIDEVLIQVKEYIRDNIKE